MNQSHNKCRFRALIEECETWWHYSREWFWITSKNLNIIRILQLSKLGHQGNLFLQVQHDLQREKSRSTQQITQKLNVKTHSLPETLLTPQLTHLQFGWVNNTGAVESSSIGAPSIWISKQYCFWIGWLSSKSWRIILNFTQRSHFISFLAKLSALWLVNLMCICSSTFTRLN